MRHLVAAEIKAAWPAWLSVLTTFIAANFAICLSALMTEIGSHYPWPAEGEVVEDGPYVLVAAGIFNLSFTILVAHAVIGSAAGLVVASRRGAIARLALAGATPGQVMGSILAQVAVTSLLGAVIGDVLAVAALGPYLASEASERGWSFVPPTDWSLASLLGYNVLCVGIALIGAWRQARSATRISPVEALRAATGGTASRSRGIVRWIVSALLIGGAVALMIQMPEIARGMPVSMRSQIMQLALLLVLMMGVGLSTAAPLTVAAIARGWTKLVPGGVTWHLARRTVVAKGDRLTKSVIPVMFAIGMTLGLVGMGATINATFQASGDDRQLQGVGLWSLIGILGLPLLIAVAGGVSSLLMMSKQRVAELAMDGIVGATPSQQVSVPILEAVIIAVTATLLGIIMGGVGTIALAQGYSALTDMKFVLVVPWADTALVFAIATLITVAATTLPAIPSLQRPAPEVIARLIAE